MTRLRQRGLHPPTSSRATIAQWVAAELVVARRTILDALQLKRSDRQARWKHLVPKLWQDRPLVLYRWLEGNSRWCSIAGLKVTLQGSVPILTAAGTQCTTVQEVDDAVKGYWVDHVCSGCICRRMQAGLRSSALGACAVRYPRLEVASWRKWWLVTLANHVGLVGTVYRH